jgi:hypothetical protein
MGIVSAPVQEFSTPSTTVPKAQQGYHYFCAAEFHCEGQVGDGQVNVHWQKQEHRPENWTISQE